MIARCNGRRTTDNGRRTAFTLIELLVVIAIIAVLIGLTTAAVMKFLVKGDDLKARNDITGLGQAVSQVESKFGLDHIPSRLILYERGPWGTSTLDNESKVFMKKMFPGVNLDNPPPPGFHDWNGNGTPDGPHQLEGQQCLVFLVGGIPRATENGTLGFHPSNQTPAGPGGERRGSYFAFQPKQLQRMPNGFFVYLDPWGTPYAFFSAYKLRNGYNRYGSSDCASLGVAPYAKGSNDYYQPDSFQIISAGRDQRFGPGGLWNASSPGNANTRDDVSNFAERMSAP